MVNLRKHFQEYFVAGLITLLPLWLTLTIVWIIFKWISGFAIPMLMPVFRLLFEYTQANILVRVVSFVVTIAVIWLVGVVATDLLGRRFLISLESMFIQIPFVRDIYLSIRKLVQFLFAKNRPFRQVVSVEFPRTGCYSVGFLTRQAPSELCARHGKTLFNVFIPTTPNPTTGFLVQLPKEQITELDMSVDDAVKLIISGGIIIPEDREQPVVNPS